MLTLAEPVVHALSGPVAFVVMRKSGDELVVNIGDPQMQHLAEPEAAAIQQSEDFGHDEVTQWRASSRRELVDRVQQLPNLAGGQDSRRETGAALRTQRSIRYIGGVSQPTHVDRELTNNPDPTLVC